jgi:hypothetical protein
MSSVRYYNVLSPLDKNVFLSIMNDYENKDAKT